MWIRFFKGQDPALTVEEWRAELPPGALEIRAGPCTRTEYFVDAVDKEKAYLEGVATRPCAAGTADASRELGATLDAAPAMPTEPVRYGHRERIATRAAIWCLRRATSRAQRIGEK